jgi:hypothetical protein
MASESAYQKVAHVKKAGGYVAPNSALNVAEWMLWPSFLSKDMDA